MELSMVNVLNIGIIILVNSVVTYKESAHYQPE